MLKQEYRGIWSLSCDGCGQALQEGYHTWAEANPNKNNISRFARRRGWMIGTDKQLCPTCNPKKSKNER